MFFLNSQIIEYLFTLIESILFFSFISATLRKKETLNIFTYICFVSLYFFIIAFLTNVSPFSNNTFIIVILISLIFTICLFKGTLKSKIVLTVAFFMILVLCDVFAANVLGVTLGINIQDVIFTEEWFRGFLFCTSKVILIFILKAISHLIGSDKVNIPSKYLYMIMGTFVVSLVILMVIGEIGVLTPYYYNKPIYFIISCIGILMINVFIQYIFIQLSMYYEKEQVYNIITLRNEMMEEFYTEREQIYKQTRRLGHDFKNHISCILALLNINKVDEAKKYAEDICDSITVHSVLIRSGNDIVDAVLNQKLSAAQKSYIHMDMDAVIPKEIRIKSIHLCAILANIIDNAIEASVKNKDENNRRINIKIGPYKDYLLISVSNAVKSNPLINIKKFKTTKEDNKTHGLGIQIVQNIVEKYNGSIEYGFENNILTVKILIRLSE